MASRALARSCGLAGLVGVGALAGAVLQLPALARVLVVVSRGVLFAVPTAEPVVALTFDDGPHPQLTPALAAVLQRHGARGTFFLLGAGAERHPGVVAALTVAGHEVANHLCDDRPSALLPPAEFRRQLQATDAVLRRLGGRPALLRPGSGWVRPSMLRTARRRGYRTVLGSIAVRDLRVRHPDRALRFVTRRLRPGAVVVLHEGYDERAGVVDLTDRLLDALAARGLRAVPLSELAAS